LITIRETPWDTRLLGISTIDIRVESGSAPGELIEIMLSLKADMVTVRVEEPSQQIFRILNDFNFIFAESMLTFQRYPPRPGSTEAPTVLSSPAPETGVVPDEISQRIILGMFTTDRISANPSFGKRVSAERYLSWLTDEMANGAHIRYVSHSGTIFGFFSIRELVDNRPYIALSGVFSDKKVPGGGVFLQRAILEYCGLKGLGPIETSVSLNNLAAVRAHVISGFNIISAESVFIRQI
jgi:hypothetical protein